MKTGLVSTWLRNNKHLFLLLYIPIYLIWFAALNNWERFGTMEYTLIESSLDKYIPFCEWFIIPYVIWYFYLFGSGVFLLFKDRAEYKNFMYMFIITFTASLLTFMVFPTGLDLRPETLPDSFCGWLISLIQAADPPVNVLPSMHVVGTLFPMHSVIKTKAIKSKAVKVIFAVVGVLIVLSTVMIKQHSAIDVFASIVLYIATAIIVYGRNKILRKKQK